MGMVALAKQLSRGAFVFGNGGQDMQRQAGRLRIVDGDVGSLCEMIADRTKAALGAAKARGVRLGRHGADHLAPANHAAALDRARQLAPVLLDLKRGGMSARPDGAASDRSD